MARRSVKFVLAAIALAAVGGGVWWWYESQTACCAYPDEPEFPVPQGERPKLGLMTSLPLYWPLGADMAAIASGTAETPWQRELLERGFELVPLDTLSPIAGLMEGEAETDPLAGLERLAVIQPRGLSPADNVALDAWVRKGGQLLLVLDPLLTGEYAFALGDPRRPADTALIPPVVERWGLAVAYDDTQEATRSVQIGERDFTVVQAGEGSLIADANSCAILGKGVAARCTIGAGTVILIADAALFEHRELAGANGESIQALMDFAWD